MVNKTVKLALLFFAYCSSILELEVLPTMTQMSPLGQTWLKEPLLQDNLGKPAERLNQSGF